MVAGHLQEKKGYFYMVLSYSVGGKRKTKWIPTGMAVKGNKKKAEALLMETRQNFEPEPEAEEVTELSCEIMFVDFLTMWLEIAKSTIKLTTYASYADMTNKTIIPYFKPLKRKLSELTAADIQKFYLVQLERVSDNSVIHYHAIIHRAMKYAEAEEYMNAYIDGKEDDHEKFLEYSAEVGAYELKYQVLTGIGEQLDKVNAVREKGLDAKLIYATGWNALFSLSPDYICTVLLAFVLIPYALLDKESGLEPVVRASIIGKKRGARKLILKKMLLMLGFSVAVALAFFALDLWLVHRRIGLASLGECAVGTVLPELMWSMRLWQVLLLRAVMALFGAVLAVASAQILGKLTRGSMAALLVFTGIQLLAMLVSEMTGVFFVFDISSFFGYVM